MEQAEMLDKLKLLRKPFEANQINKLPKPSPAQTEEVKKDYTKGIRCKDCGQWHHPKVIHLDYVGHAALTDRLLDVDPMWSWEPVSFDTSGQPAIDKDGGMWIRLTVCGVTRLGYGDAQGKTGGNAVKERIGDALRNAAMRFGAALDLWHKGDLHGEVESIIEVGGNVIDGNSGEVIKQKPEPEACSAEKFETNRAAWRELIVSGKKTPKALIAMLSTKAWFSEEQKLTIDSWAHEGDRQ